jgi:ABC-2 type transport system permease protein
MQAGGRKKRTAAARLAPAPARTAASPLAEFIPQPVLGMIGKDFLTLRRDPRSMSQLITPLIIGIVYGLFFLRSGAAPTVGPGGGPDMDLQVFKNIMVYGGVGLALFVSWSLQSRLALMGFSQEGKNYWILKSAPISSRRLIAAKFLVAYLPALVIGWVFMLVVSLLQHTPLGVLIFGLIVVAVSITGVAGINLSFGIAGVNLTWEDPRRMNSGFSGCLSIIASLGYLVVDATLFIGPSILLAVFGGPALAGEAIGLVLGVAFSLACAVIPLSLTSARVARIGEN